MRPRIAVGWSGYLDREDNVCHIIPDDDSIVHEYAEDCVCRPKTDLQDGLDVVFHTALDGRTLSPEPREPIRITICLHCAARYAAVAAVAAGVAWWLSEPWRAR